jgi:hypothetical protein
MPVAVASENTTTSSAVENAIVSATEAITDAIVETVVEPTFVPLVPAPKSVSATSIESTVSAIEAAPVVADEISWASASYLFRPADAVAMPEAPAVSRQLASSAETFGNAFETAHSTTAILRTASPARSSAQSVVLISLREKPHPTTTSPASTLAQSVATDDTDKLQSVVAKKSPGKTGPLQAGSLSGRSVDWLFRNGLL